MSFSANDNRREASKNFPIIGGGATGPMLLAYMAKEAVVQGVRLDGEVFHLIDPNGFGNGGIAYGKSHRKHKLNSISTEMDPINPDRFGQAMTEQNVISLPDTFHDRSQFQPYIEQEFVQKSIETLRTRGATIVEHKTTGFVRDNKDGTFAILTQDPLTNPDAPLVDPRLTGLTKDDLALTVGYGPNTNFPELRGKAGYIHSPYDRALSLIEREPLLQREGITIAVAGAGPALYDIVNELEPSAANKLLVFSREGRRLTTRDASIEAFETSFPPRELLQLDHMSTLQQAIAALNAEFQEYRQGRSDRRVALDVNKYKKEILLSLAPDVAIAFRQSSELRSINGTATPVPQASQDRLDEFNPRFIAQRLNGNVSPSDSSVIIAQDDGTTHEVDVFINATGHGRHNAAVIESLKAQGLVAC